MNVTRLYTNIPQEKGIHIVCKAYWTPSIKPNLLFVQNYFKEHSDLFAVAFTNIFMAKIETEIENQRTLKPLVWKRIIWMRSSPSGTQPETSFQFNEQANKHPFSPRGRFVLQTEILGKFIITFQLF